MNKYAATVFQTVLYIVGTREQNARRVAPSKLVNGDRVNIGRKEWISCWIIYRYTAINRDAVRNVGVPPAATSMSVSDVGDT